MTVSEIRLKEKTKITISHASLYTPNYSNFKLIFSSLKWKHSIGISYVTQVLRYLKTKYDVWLTKKYEIHCYDKSSMSEV